MSDSPFVVLAGEQIGKNPATGKPWPANMMMIEYIPEWSERIPYGEKIVLVQSVIHEVDGALMPPSAFHAGFAWIDDICLKEKHNLGMAIDGLKGEPQPFYNDSYGTESASDVERPYWGVGELQRASLRNHRASVTVAQAKSFNTLRYGQPCVTRLNDTPTTSGGNKGFQSEKNPAGIGKVVKNFQVFAYCSKGLCGGEWYEGVSWRYVKTWMEQRDGTPGTSVLLGDLERPSKDFLDAFERFNRFTGFKPP